MSELKLKNTVRPRSLVIAAAVINSANQLKFTFDMVITSANDSKHMAGSKHYSNEALDFRIKQMSINETKLLIENTRKRLGKNYQVIIEDTGKPNQHIHIEYDPS